MTETAYGSGNYWKGLVINVTDDPDKEGRVQVRVFGQHDDPTTIPDGALLWAKVQQGTDNAAHNKIGTNATGLIKGSIVSGHYLDSDRQVLIVTATIHKAGDETSGTTQNGVPSLVPGSGSAAYDASNPLIRSYWGPQVAKNNPLLAIENHDQATISTASGNGGQGIVQQQQGTDAGIKTNDGVDPTAAGYSKAKQANNPTVGSIQNPSGSILSQLQSVDPSHLTSILPQAVSAISKILDIQAFSSTNGSTNVLGSVFGQAIASIGISTVVTAIGNNLQNASLLTPMSLQALSVALIGLGANPVSDGVQSVVNSVLTEFIVALEFLINSNTLNELTFNALIETFFPTIQNNGANQSVGANIGSVLSQVQTLLPQIAPAINSTLNQHLPTSVLNVSVVTAALQGFAMQQAFLKAPNTGLKALGTQATQQGGASTSKSISSSLTGQNGISEQTVTNVSNLYS